jgi:hypothetical protein
MDAAPIRRLASHVRRITGHSFAAIRVHARFRSRTFRSSVDAYGDNYGRR